VALLDLDLQFGNAGVYLDLEDNGGLLDLMSAPINPTRQDILRAAQASSYGVDVLTAPSIFTPIDVMTDGRVKEILSAFMAHYAYVVVDLPKVVVDWIEPVIALSDRLVLVSDLSVPCIRQAKRLIDLYRETNVTLPVDLVLNRERKTILKSEAQRDAEKFLDLGVAAWVPENTYEERRSIDLGKPTAGRRSKGRAAYRRLGKSLAKQAAQNHTSTTGR
jgi:pilus assembly protein CpaE